MTNDLNQDQRMHRICSSLADAGWNVTLVGRMKKKSTPLLAMPFTQKRMTCLFEKGPAFYLEYNLRLWIYLLRIAKGTKVVYSVDTDTVLACSMAARITGKPLIYDAHEYFTETPELIRRPVVKAIWAMIERISLPYAALCITVSQSLADILGQLAGKKFHTILNVPTKDTSGYDDHKQSGKPYILYQGMVNEGRGLENMIRALPSIPDTDLVIAGDGDIMDTIRQLAASGPASDRVILAGWQTPDQLKALTRDASLGLNLLESHSKSYYYSLANKYFDYMHAGVPCLSMDFPEYRRINDEYQTGILIQSTDPTLIADKVNSLFANPGTLNLIKKNCRKASEIFCWDREKIKLVELVDGLL